MHRRILAIAIPSIISNITVPLLGLADTAITGHLGSAAYMAAIAIGTSVFSTCYWIFSFLRMATGGLTAQRFGAQDWAGCRLCLTRALTVGTIVSAAIILFQQPLAALALVLMDASPEVHGLSLQYFRILVWGAPASLGLFAFNGWFIGMQNARIPMVVAIVQNVVNVALSCLLVMGVGWRIEGVATGTLVAQWTGFLLAAWQARRLFCATRAKAEGRRLPHVSWNCYFSVGRDIFLRTLCLVSVMFSFTVFGSHIGEDVLSANTILMQFFLFVSYFMDGFAYAGEALGGRFLGEASRQRFMRLHSALFVWGSGVAALFTLLLLFGGEAAIALLTNVESVRSAAGMFLPFVVAVPMVSTATFIYDGLFIGTTATRSMFLSTAIATLFYFLLSLTAFAGMAASPNVWLWSGFLVYLATRGIVQALLLPGIVGRKFGRAASKGEA